MATQMVDGAEGTTQVVEVADPEISATTHRPFRRRILMVVGAAVLLAAGTGAGWLLRGDDGGSPPSYVLGRSVIAGDELTERQFEMVDITRDYVAAFMAKDGDAVASFMVPDGYLAMPTLGNKVVRAEDGSLPEWVEGLGMIPNELHDPIVVRDDHVVLTGHLDAPTVDWMMMIRFTDAGEVKIVSDTHWARAA